MNIKVSIMITCYNCEASINDAIFSVVSQDMPFNWELLIGDDGSNDNSIEYIKRWIEKYPCNISLFEMNRDCDEEKNGTRAARNRANLLEHALGDYLIFLDGDDLFLSTEKIKRQVDILDSLDYLNCSCVAHNILANDIEHGLLYPMTNINFPEGTVDSVKYWKNMYFHTNTILFRRNCLPMMLNSNFRDYLNDNFITFILLQNGQIYYINEIWAQYNLTGNGLWTGKSRIVGCFRNIILYDYERKINYKMRYASFVRHLYDFRYILKNYNVKDKDSIKLLVKNISPQEFHYTFLLYKLSNELQLSDNFKKNTLKVRVFIVFQITRLTNNLNNIKFNIMKSNKRG